MQVYHCEEDVSTSVLRCECADPGCPAHEGEEGHEVAATTRLYRVDMYDRTGTWFCDTCAEDAMESGLFSTERNFYS